MLLRANLGVLNLYTLYVENVKLILPVMFLFYLFIYKLET